MQDIFIHIQFNKPVKMILQKSISFSISMLILTFSTSKRDPQK
jgi:hypothetical protein